MIVVAHAHRDEVNANRSRDRALARVACILSELRARGIDNPAELPDRAWRRYLRAQAAAGVSMRAAFIAQRRHSKWYRAYLRVRRRLDGAA